MVVPVLITSCQVSEKPKIGPLTAQTITIPAARMKVDALPAARCLVGEIAEELRYARRLAFVLAGHVTLISRLLNRRRSLGFHHTGTLALAAHCPGGWRKTRHPIRGIEMIDKVVVAPGDSRASSLSGVSWPSIVAGAVVACAMTLVLIAFGTGLGLSVVSPWSGSGISTTTFKITTGIYLIVIAMISSSLGGLYRGPAEVGLGRRRA